jgi:hypothetical protein
MKLSLPKDVDTTASLEKGLSGYAHPLDCNLTIADRESSRLNSGEFTDLAITCHDKTFYVHKILVCAHSPVLHNALKKETFKVSARQFKAMK